MAMWGMLKYCGRVLRNAKTKGQGRVGADLRRAEEQDKSRKKMDSIRGVALGASQENNLCSS